MKETDFWPELNDQLKKFILICELHLKYSQSKCKQKPTMSLGQEIPLHPWTKLATDLFNFNANHITSSPHYPQCNGCPEKYVQIVKSLFYKAKEDGKDLFKCLMIYHNMPLSGSL